MRSSGHHRSLPTPMCAQTCRRFAFSIDWLLYCVKYVFYRFRCSGYIGEVCFAIGCHFDQFWWWLRYFDFDFRNVVSVVHQNAFLAWFDLCDLYQQVYFCSPFMLMIFEILIDSQFMVHQTYKSFFEEVFLNVVIQRAILGQVFQKNRFRSFFFPCNLRFFLKNCSSLAALLQKVLNCK